MAKSLEEEQRETTDYLLGRRSFDRQMELLTVAVHTLQRDFAAMEERVRGVQSSAHGLSIMIQQVEEDVHKLDKALIARLATITVTERVLWALATGVIGIAVHFLSRGPL